MPAASRSSSFRPNASRRRFTIESLVTGNLEHPGVPTVYERGETAEGTAFYAMRLVQGRTLDEALAEAKTLAERLKLVSVVVRVAQTLGFAHERGVIHRDIKPENIVVGRHGETVVLDWGIAKLRGSAGEGGAPSALEEQAQARATQHGSVLGTPAYMAPEQAKGDVDAIDERTDVFALGALLYHLLTGRAPYDGSSLREVLERATRVELEPIDAAAPRAPEGLRRICQKAMARAPSERHRSAHELAEELESYTAGALLAVPTTMRAVVAIVTAATLVASAALLAIAWQQVAPFREQGTTALVYAFLGAVGCVSSLIEWRTRGRHQLAPVSLALALAVFFAGIAGTVVGVEIVLRAVQKELADPITFRSLLLDGMFESLAGLATASAIATVQIILWGAARRSVLLAR